MASADGGSRVLRMHRCRERGYELVGARTVAVRDQILRASLLVRALCMGKRPELHEGAALLVIGGGAAGVAAALTAAEAGVVCVLVERESEVFRRQWDVTTRWLDPTEFDWPQPHWISPTWPPEYPDTHHMPPSPLFYEPDWANKLARRWHDDLQTWLDDREAALDEGRPAPAALHVIRNIDSSALTIEFMPDKVLVSRIGEPWPLREFSAVISCIGHGQERVAVDLPAAAGFSGFKFWSSDSLNRPSLGAAAGQSNAGPLNEVNALVSGGGDGAQQDLQRILCADFGRRLLSRIHPREQREVDLPSLLQADRDREAAHKGPYNSADSALALDAWDQHLKNAAEDLWKALNATRQRDLATRLLRTDALEGRVQLTWLLGGNRPTRCYGLNRFLTQLTLLAYAQVTGRPLWSSATPLRPGTAATQAVVIAGHEIRGITSADSSHTCAHRPKECHGQLHEVSIGPAADASVVAPLARYHVIVIRHGLEKATLFGGAPEPEQFMPFALED